MYKKKMGTWDTGLYQNDLSADVRDDYISKLKAGKKDEEALEEILLEYQEASVDCDEKYDFYIGLGDILWEKGRLPQEFKNQILKIIEEDKVSERWQDEKIRKERIKILEKFKEKLESPMPARKKIIIHKPYKLGWEEGDVYCFQITGHIEKYVKGYEEFVGWYAMLYVDRIYTKDWQVKDVQDEIAELYFYLRENKPIYPEDIYTSKNICFSKGKKENQYKVYLCESSKKNRPKDLSFLGKIVDFKIPEKCSNVAMFFSWGNYLYERDILWGYERQIKENN